MVVADRLRRERVEEVVAHLPVERGRAGGVLEGVCDTVLALHSDEEVLIMIEYPTY